VFTVRIEFDAFRGLVAITEADGETEAPASKYTFEAPSASLCAAAAASASALRCAATCSVSTLRAATAASASNLHSADTFSYRKKER